MLGNGEAQKGAIRPDFNKSIFIDFAGAKWEESRGGHHNFLTDFKTSQDLQNFIFSSQFL
jgi:hypothetical protein